MPYLPTDQEHKEIAETIRDFVEGRLKITALEKACAVLSESIGVKAGAIIPH